VTSISEKLLRDWKKAKSCLEEMPKTKKACRHSVTPYLPLEKILFEWVSELRQSGYIITRVMVRQRALYIHKTKKDLDIPDTFKASAGWCTRFLRRNSLTLRQKTHIAQKLPAEVETKVDLFHSFVLKERKAIEYELSQIGNMDETPMNFDMPGNRTLDMKGAKTVSVKTCGAEKQHFTVVLSCMADGTKLKPMLIFKRKTVPKEKFPPGVLICVQEKGWMNETLVMRWVSDVWMTRPGGLRGTRSLLVWDMFRAHLCEGVKKKLKESRIRQAVIPGGCTSLLQPLDVSLNKPFKCGVRAAWNDWMVNGTHSYTKTNNRRRAPLPTVAKWVLDAWNGIPPDMVRRSFLKCGIANALDGTQDDELYADLVSDQSRPAEVEVCEVDDDDDESTYQDYYDDAVDTAAWDILNAEDSDTEFDGFTEADL